MGQTQRGVPQDPSLKERTRSIGAYLAGHRRLRGLSLDDLSDATRIPQRSLERLEAGAFDGQTDGFARGFVRAVAEALGLDPEDAVARMLEEHRDQGARRARARAGTRAPRMIGLAVLLTAGALLLVLGLAWLRSGPEPAGGGGDDLVYRRDPVRELSAEVARSPAPDPTTRDRDPLGEEPAAP